MRQKKCKLSAFTQGVLKLALAAREDGPDGNLTRAATPERSGSRRTCRQLNTLSKQSVKYVSGEGGGGSWRGTTAARRQLAGEGTPLTELVPNVLRLFGAHVSLPVRVSVYELRSRDRVWAPLLACAICFPSAATEPCARPVFHAIPWPQRRYANTPSSSFQPCEAPHLLVFIASAGRSPPKVTRIRSGCSEQAGFEPTLKGAEIGSLKARQGTGTPRRTHVR